MWRTVKRKLLPNPFDRLLQKAAKKGATTFLLGWNRGIGDVPLGIYPLVLKIKEKIPDAKITFLIRKDLEEAFSLFPEVKCIVDSTFIRGKPYDISQSCFVKKDRYDVRINWPDPTYWCRSLLGKFVPKLQWRKDWDEAYKQLGLDPKHKYVGIQPNIASDHGPWRSWGKENFTRLIRLLEKKYDRKVLLLGSAAEQSVFDAGIDLRGKTTFSQLLSLIKNLCREVVLPDSGILSILYYLDISSPLRIVSLWAKPFQGVMKQNVPSPNKNLRHTPLVGGYKNIRTIEVDQVIESLVHNHASV